MGRSRGFGCLVSSKENYLKLFQLRYPTNAEISPTVMIHCLPIHLHGRAADRIYSVTDSRA